MRDVRDESGVFEEVVNGRGESRVHGVPSVQVGWAGERRSCADGRDGEDAKEVEDTGQKPAEDGEQDVQGRGDVVERAGWPNVGQGVDGRRRKGSRGANRACRRGLNE